MRIPLRQMIDLGRYMRAKKKAGEKYFPLVLMLEPLHACNLACIGCGRIVEYKDTIRDMMPLDEALHSARGSRRADRVDLRRRAVDVQAYRGADARADRGSEASRHDLHQCDPARAIRQAGTAESVSQLQPAPGRDARDQRSRDRSSGAFRHRRQDDQDAEGEGLPGADQHDGVPRDHRAKSSRSMVKYLTSLGVDGMLLSPGYHYQVLQNDDELSDQGRDAGEVLQGSRSWRTTTRLSTRRFTWITWSANATCSAVRGRRSRAIRRDGRAPAI